MVKGMRKNVFVLKCDKGSPFESAFFVLRTSAEKPVDDDIVREAERLVGSVWAESELPKKDKKSKKKKLK